ncbi:MAG TPA: glycosyltransferase family 2 protein [Xanthomonadaceae bacterium]|nr:glycosyltransferase family 2 protein [Xanthomonadaceae bacterium]
MVVACNSGPILAECVRRVLASSAEVDVVVVDNASSDGCLEDLPESVILVRHDTNLGFAAGCNRGAREACGDVLLFLNPDCLVEENSIAMLRARLDRHPQVGLLGACVLDSDGREQRGLRRHDPTPWRSLMAISGLARWASRHPWMQGIEASRTHMPEFLEYYDAVSGALMMLPRAVFDAVDGFDEGYFLHCEDLDLCRRVRAAGWRVAVAAHVPVVHVGGTSSRSRPLFVAWHKHRGMVRYYRKFEARRLPFGTRWAVPAAVWIKFTLALPFVLLSGLRGNRG